MLASKEEIRRNAGFFFFIKHFGHISLTQITEARTCYFFVYIACLKKLSFLATIKNNSVFEYYIKFMSTCAKNGTFSEQYSQTLISFAFFDYK